MQENTFNFKVNIHGIDTYSQFNVNPKTLIGNLKLFIIQDLALKILKGNVIENQKKDLEKILKHKLLFSCSEKGDDSAPFNILKNNNSTLEKSIKCNTNKRVFDLWVTPTMGTTNKNNLE